MIQLVMKMIAALAIKGFFDIRFYRIAKIFFRFYFFTGIHFFIELLTKLPLFYQPYFSNSYFKIFFKIGSIVFISTQIAFQPLSFFIVKSGF